MSDLAGHLPPALGGNEPRAEPVPTVSGARAVFHDVKALRTPTTRRPTAHYHRHTSFKVRPRPAFSLMELMIGIIILGLGMVMVATMFPVGWSRARTLREYTVHKAVTANAHATVKSLVRVSSPTFNASSFLGDLVYDPHDPSDPSDDTPISTCPDYYEQIGDTWVHALNLENIQVADRQFVSEDPWSIQDSEDQHLFRLCDPLSGDLAGNPVCENSFFRKQISFHQRVYPPLEILPNDADDAQKRRWDDALATRRFCWAVFHRLREVIDPNDPDATGNIRAFDVYFVTLRRPNPTYRYARQDRATGPNPCVLVTTPDVLPGSLSSDEDVMFPVPWRVQVQFLPNTLPLREYDAGVTPPERKPTGIPTEIEVPPPDAPGANPATNVMLLQMFPTGAWFIDEISGQVYRVMKRRVIGNDADQAVLTLDREVFLEDVNLYDIAPGVSDPRCEFCTPLSLSDPKADREELLRTVWIFPPSVQATRAKGNILVFEGSQPAVDIEVQTVKIPPTE